jgi:hypothetical protein
MRNLILLVVAAATVPALVSAQSGLSARPAKRAEVLVLGVYHMANPGRDIFNMRADDVLSAKRQNEIAELEAVLKDFRPTKIAVEAPFGDEVVPKRYAEYRAGTRPLSRNETEQIGFRLAKDLDLATIYPVDEEAEFPFQRVVDYAKATGQSAKLDSLMAEIGEMVRAQGEYLKTHTVLRTLLYMNSDSRVAQDVGYYYLQAHFGEPGDYAGPDLLAEWYRRNLRIYNNVTKLVASPEDRILVIFGAGHLGWLRQDFASDPTLRLRTLEEFARSAKGDIERT